jgi:hypothetical protein
MSRKQELPWLLERIQRCRSCGQEVAHGSLSFLENPFCDNCLNARIAEAQSQLGEIRWRTVGRYMELSPLTPQRLV